MPIAEKSENPEPRNPEPTTPARPTIPLAVALTLLLACGGSGGSGSTPSEPPPPAADGGSEVVEVAVDDFTYSPRVVRVDPGTTVRWVLEGDDTNHTVTARDGEFDSGFAFQQPGDAFEHVFEEEDDGMTFEYSCTSHSDCCDMKGSVRVGEDSPAPDPEYQ